MAGMRRHGDGDGNGNGHVDGGEADWSGSSSAESESESESESGSSSDSEASSGSGDSSGSGASSDEGGDRPRGKRFRGRKRLRGWRACVRRWKALLVFGALVGAVVVAANIAMALSGSSGYTYPPPAPPWPPAPPPSPPPPPFPPGWAPPPAYAPGAVDVSLVMVLVWGLVPTLVAIVAAAWCLCRSDAAQRRLMRGMRVSGAAELASALPPPPAALVGRVVGRLRPEGAHLLSALTGRRCVWYRASCLRQRRRGKRTTIDILAQEEAAVDALLDDGSGAAILVELGQMAREGEGAYRVDSESGAKSPDHSSSGRWPICFREFLRRADCWEEDHGERALDAWRRAGDAWFIEQVLLEGETVAVVGCYEAVVEGDAALRVGAARGAGGGRGVQAALGAARWWPAACVLRLDFRRLGGRVLISDVPMAAEETRGRGMPPVAIDGGSALVRARSGELVDAAGLPADFYASIGGDEAVVLDEGDGGRAAFGPLPIAAPAQTLP